MAIRNNNVGVLQMIHAAMKCFVTILFTLVGVNLCYGSELILQAPCVQMDRYSMDEEQLLWERPHAPVFDRWEIKTGMLGALWQDTAADFSAWTGISSPSQALALYRNAVPYTSSAMQTACPGYGVVGSFINTWSTHAAESSAGGPHSTLLYAFAYNTGPKLGTLFLRNPGSKLTAQFWGAIPQFQIGASQPGTYPDPYAVNCQLGMTLILHHLSDQGYPDKAYEILLNAFDSRPRMSNYEPFALNLGEEYPKLFSMPIGDTYPVYSGYDANFARQRSASWSGIQLFRATMTSGQIVKILQQLGDPAPNLDRYRISQFGTLHEVTEHIDGINEMSCGATVAEPALLMM